MCNLSMIYELQERLHMKTNIYIGNEDNRMKHRLMKIERHLMSIESWSL